jgi:ribosomal protein L7Ae-like RNA K-turn-binding protein
MNYKQIITESPLKVVGLNQVLKGIAKDNVRCVVIACDSESFVGECVKDAIGAKCVDILSGPSRKELGEIVGVEVPTAVVGIVK